MRSPVAFAASLLIAVLLGSCSPSPATQSSERAAEPVPAQVPTQVETPVAQPPILAPLPSQFRALGTEPFWSAAVDGARLTYSTPETPESTSIVVSRRDAGNGVLYTGSIDGKPLELRIRRATCSDGMSDTVYPFAVIRRIGPDSVRGCAR